MNVLPADRPVRCLITAGPTREFIDPVRYLSNASSGKMGYALANAAANRNWEVTLVSGPVALSDPAGVSVERVVSAAEMFEACAAKFDQIDVLIMVAAVADYRVASIGSEKTKKKGGEWTLELVPTIDVLKTLGARKTHQVLIGFAAETHELERYAQRKLEEKNLDWIVANDVSRPGVGMEADQNQVILFSRAGGRVEYGPAAKADVAEFILNAVAPVAKS